jgi:formin 2
VEIESNVVDDGISGTSRVARHRSGSEWPWISWPLALDSVGLHTVLSSKFYSEASCRPYLRIHGQDSSPGNKCAKALF